MKKVVVKADGTMRNAQPQHQSQNRAGAGAGASSSMLNTRSNAASGAATGSGTSAPTGSSSRSSSPSSTSSADNQANLNAEREPRTHTQSSQSRQKKATYEEVLMMFSALKSQAEELSVPYSIVTDAGRTQVAAGSVTVFGLFGTNAQIDPLTSFFPLL